MANTNLGDAKAAKNDEFYTQYHDIEYEVNAYIEYDPDVFRGKTILLPCDDPEWSNFTKYFAQNFDRFGLKRLISTSYAPESPMDDEHWKSDKNGYNWSNYGFTTDGGITFTKYTGSDYAVLQAADDAATQSTDWGSSWRMPTLAEWKALLETSGFTWAWVENFNGSGKNGRLVISRKSGVEGNCIFLPAPCRFGGRAYAARPFKVSARPLKGLDGPLVSVGFPQSSLDKFAACLGTQTCETRLCRRGRWCCS